MRKIILAAMAAALLSTTATLACDVHGITGIAEKNDLWIAPNAKETSGITEERFNAVLDRITAIYEPILEGMGKKFVVNRLWDSGTVNASAQQRRNTWIINMYGGLARHKEVIEDAFALVACHEMGHHLGGAPKKGFMSSWASNEGQSDFWGNMKCLRKYMEADQNVAIVSAMEVPELVTKKCQANFKEPNDIAMCQRGSMAGLSLARLLGSLRRIDVDTLKFETPDQRVVTSTNHNHPAAQCRLDSYFAGAMCERNHFDDVSNTDANLNVCNRRDSDTDGIRPLCWFKPKAI